MLTVACVLKSGGIYDASWVDRLHNGVTRHLPEEHRFICLSDVAAPCERIALRHDWPGWWSKVELFRQYGPLVYFDLDTVIVGDLTPLADLAREVPFAMLRDFYRPDGLGSGVMAWSGQDQSLINIYDVFAEHPKTYMATYETGGDQAYIESRVHIPHVVRIQDNVGGVLSYKVDCRWGLPYGARSIALHGRPKFGDMPINDPVRLAWEACA